MKRYKKVALLFTSVVLGLSTLTLLTSRSSVAQSTQSNFYLPYPIGLKYQVTQTWNSLQGSHSDYYNKYAVDFGMSVGQAVAAVAPGKVIRSSRGKTDIASGCDYRYGNNAHYIVIDHGNNVSSLYLHLSEVNVSVGETISQGQIIGKSGNTGYVCGPHLHLSFQKTDTVGTYAGESIPIGFIETQKGTPQLGAIYTSQNSTMGGLVQLELKATPLSGVKQCLEIDGTKIGIRPDASRANVGACRPIQEQQFRVIDDGNGFRRFELKATPLSGVKQCLEIDGTKIGIRPDASRANVGACRPIQEQQFRVIDDGNGFRRFELKATPLSGVKQCLEIDGTKIGIRPDASRANVGACRPIQEQQFQVK